MIKDPIVCYDEKTDEIVLIGKFKGNDIWTIVEREDFIVLGCSGDVLDKYEILGKL